MTTRSDGRLVEAGGKQPISQLARIEKGHGVTDMADPK